MLDHNIFSLRERRQIKFNLEATQMLREWSLSDQSEETARSFRIRHAEFNRRLKRAGLVISDLAGEKLAATLRARGFTVRIVHPPAGCADFNDALDTGAA